MPTEFNRDWWSGNISRTNIVKEYPNENLVRFYKKNFDGMAARRVLDIGFNTGADLLAMARAGAECHGIEVSMAAMDVAIARFEREGFAVNLRAGEDLLPDFPSAGFDFIYSLETLHYVGDRAAIRASLGECSRLLKPGGALLVSMPTPEHHFCLKSKDLGGNMREFDERFPQRRGLRFYVIADEEDARSLFSSFDSLQIGRYEWSFDSETITSFWLISGWNKGDK